MARWQDQVLPAGWAGPGSLAAKVSDALSLQYVGTTKSMGIPLPDWRKSTARTAVLAATASGGDFGLAAAAGGGMVSSTSNNTSVTDAARIEIRLPESYVAGGTLTVKVRGKVVITRFVAQTLGVSAKKVVDHTVGAELCTTGAISITTGYADYGFNLTPTGLVSGDVLALVLTAIGNDTGGSGGASTIIITKTWLEFVGT